MKESLFKAAIAAACCLAGASAQADVMVSNSTYGVFDGSSGSRIFNVGSHGTVGDVNITIDFSKCDDPPIGPGGTACIGTGEGWPNEIEFRLMGPNGTTVDLVTAGTYFEGSGRFLITFDDEAGSTVGGQVQNGAFRPVGTLAELDGMDMFGSWSLMIADLGFGDPLEYFSATLAISDGDAAEVPEPATAGILGLGMLGLLGARRRSR